MNTRTYSDAREHLATVIEDVISTREAEMTTRRDDEHVAIIPAEALAGLLGPPTCSARERIPQRPQSAAYALLTKAEARKWTLKENPLTRLDPRSRLCLGPSATEVRRNRE